MSETEVPLNVERIENVTGMPISEMMALASRLPSPISERRLTTRLGMIIHERSEMTQREVADLLEMKQPTLSVALQDWSGDYVDVDEIESTGDELLYLTTLLVDNGGDPQLKYVGDDL